MIGVVEWCNEKEVAVPSEENFPDLFEEVFGSSYELNHLLSPYETLYFREVDRVISTHLTKSDAEWLIERKKHDYPTLIRM